MEGCRSSGNPKVGQFNEPLFCCEDIGPFDVPMYDTLLVEIQESMEYL